MKCSEWMEMIKMLMVKVELSVSVFWLWWSFICRSSQKRRDLKAVFMVLVSHLQEQLAEVGEFWTETSERMFELSKVELRATAGLNWRFVHTDKHGGPGVISLAPSPGFRILSSTGLHINSTRVQVILPDEQAPPTELSAAVSLLNFWGKGVVSTGRH